MGGLGAFLLFIKQNLAQVVKPISATINCSSNISANVTGYAPIHGSIFNYSNVNANILAIGYLNSITSNTSQTNGLLYNYLADKRIYPISYTNSDDILIADPIIPKPIQEIPLPPIPPIPPFTGCPAPISIIASSYFLTASIPPAPIAHEVNLPVPVVIVENSVNLAISKSYDQLTSPLIPARIILKPIQEIFSIPIPPFAGCPVPVSIMASNYSLAISISPTLIVHEVGSPTPTAMVGNPINPAISKSYDQLASPLIPVKIIESSNKI